MLDGPPEGRGRSNSGLHQAEVLSLATSSSKHISSPDMRYLQPRLCSTPNVSITVQAKGCLHTLENHQQGRRSIKYFLRIPCARLRMVRTLTLLPHSVALARSNNVAPRSGNVVQHIHSLIK